MSCEGVITCKAKVNWKLDFQPCFCIIIIIYYHNLFQFFSCPSLLPGLLDFVGIGKKLIPKNFSWRLPLPKTENVLVEEKGSCLDVEYFLWNVIPRTWGVDNLLLSTGIFPRWDTAIKLGESYLCWHNCIVIQHPHFKHFYYRTLI